MRLGRRFSLLFVSLLALMLIAAACGEEEPTDAGSDDSGTEEPAEGEPEYNLVEEGVLTVGSDIPYPPFEFEEGGELTGFDVEIVREVADRLGLENPDEAWISTDFGTIFQQLASGSQFDIVAAAVTGYAPEGTPASETVAERTAVVDFTVPFYPSLQSLTVDSEASPDITSVDSLPDGARVGVQRATTGAFYAEENLTGAELVSFEKAPQMYQQLQAGQLDAVFNDLPVTVDSIKDKPGLEIVEQVPTGEEYAIAVSKDNPELTDAINGALEEMFDDGSFAEIYTKYFPEQELPEYASD
jgi:polar amino acid transport system substrate-binding protein